MQYFYDDVLIICDNIGVADISFGLMLYMLIFSIKYDACSFLFPEADIYSFALTNHYFVSVI